MIKGENIPVVKSSKGQQFLEKNLYKYFLWQKKNKKRKRTSYRPTHKLLFKHIRRQMGLCSKASKLDLQSWLNSFDSLVNSEWNNLNEGLSGNFLRIFCWPYPHNKTHLRRRPSCQTLSKAFEICKPTSRVPPHLSRYL